MPGEVLFMLVFVVGMIAGVIVIMMAMWQRSQQIQMQHRERMAMIERGQVPTEPSNLTQRLGAGSRPGVAGARYMSLGIIVVALGLGLMTIVSVAGGAPDAGVGIGGAIIILGLAFIANSLVSRSHPGPYVPPPFVPPAPPPPPAPRQDDIR